MPDLEIIKTSDGSHSILNKALNETYHSHHGAVQESLHVFLQHGLEFFIAKFQKQKVNIFEVGFGTGLNAFLALNFAMAYPEVEFSYTTLETYPLPKEIWSKLNYATSPGEKEIFDSIHTCTWDEPHLLYGNFKFIKRNTSLQELALPSDINDIVFYDAFAPNKQPEMWTINLIGKTVASLKLDGVFVTYCAKGQLKRDLQSLHLIVETLSGPPGKKEMVRAIKVSDSH